MLEFLVSDFSPRAATFFTLDERGGPVLRAARGPDLPPGELAVEVAGWIGALDGIDPLAPVRIAAGTGPVATFADVAGPRGIRGRSSLRAVYERIGVINDARMRIRDGSRLIAGVTLWRRFGSRPWATDQLERLAVLQPLVEMAYLRARLRRPPDEQSLPDGLTPRQRDVAVLLGRGATNREVARALRISEATARSHTRAAMAKLGISSRQEVPLRLAAGPGGPRAGIQGA